MTSSSTGVGSQREHLQPRRGGRRRTTQYLQAFPATRARGKPAWGASLLIDWLKKKITDIGLQNPSTSDPHLIVGYRVVSPLWEEEDSDPDSPSKRDCMIGPVKRLGPGEDHLLVYHLVEPRGELVAWRRISRSFDKERRLFQGALVRGGRLLAANVEEEDFSLRVEGDEHVKSKSPPSRILSPRLFRHHQ